MEQPNPHQAKLSREHQGEALLLQLGSPGQGTGMLERVQQRAMEEVVE